MLTIRILQVIVAITLIILIMLQERSSGLSGAFGGSGESFARQRRGFEKIIFNLTVVSLTAFIVLSILNFVI